MGLPRARSGNQPGGQGPPGWIARARRRARAGAARLEAERPRHLSIDVSLSALERDRQVAAGVLAGGLAFRVFLWLLPLSLFASGVAGFLPSEQVGAAAGSLGLAGAAIDSVEDAAAQASRSRFWLLGLGGALLIWTGATAVRALELTYAVTWGVRPRKASRPLVAAVAFTGGCLAIMAAGAGLAWARTRFGDGGLLFGLVPLAALFAIWMWASRRLPRAAGTTWRDLLPGAVLVAVASVVLHAAIVFLLAPKLARSQDLYGVLGVASTFLFWLYLMGRIVVASAILSASLWERRHGGSPGSHDDWAREPKSIAERSPMTGSTDRRLP